jgi:hypothetical protein
LQKLLYVIFVVGVGRANEMIVGDTTVVPGQSKLMADLVGVGLRRRTGSVSRLSDFVAMLVGAGEQERLEPERLVLAFQCVRHHGRIGMTQVRFRVDVVKWRCNVNAIHQR